MKMVFCVLYKFDCGFYYWILWQGFKHTFINPTPVPR